MKRPGVDTRACVNTACQLFHRSRSNGLTIRRCYGHNRIRLRRCHTCGEESSERRGTALFNTKLVEEQAVAVMHHLDVGYGVRSIAR